MADTTASPHIIPTTTTATPEQGRLTLYQYSAYQNDDLKLSVASINPHCLTVHTYLKMCGAPFDVVDINDDAASPSGRGLPVLAVNQANTYSGVHDIISVLSKLNYVPRGNSELSETQLAESKILASFIQEKIYRYQLYSWWIELQNYEMFTHNIYAQHRKFPMSWWAPKSQRKKVFTQFENLGISTEFSQKEKFYEEAISDYEILATKLGQKDFFFGDRPTTIDCFVFGFLMTQMVPRIPNNTLLRIICTHKNLVQFCDRMERNFYSGVEISLIDSRPLMEYTTRKKAKQIALMERDRRMDLEWNSTLAIIGSFIAVVLFGFNYNTEFRAISSFLLNKANSMMAAPDNLENSRISRPVGLPSAAMPIVEPRFFPHKG